MIGPWSTIAVLTAVALGLLLVPLARRGRAAARTRESFNTILGGEGLKFDRDVPGPVFTQERSSSGSGPEFAECRGQTFIGSETRPSCAFVAFERRRRTSRCDGWLDGA